MMTLAVRTKRIAEVLNPIEVRLRKFGGDRIAVTSAGNFKTTFVGASQGIPDIRLEVRRDNSVSHASDHPARAGTFSSIGDAVQKSRNGSRHEFAQPEGWQDVFWASANQLMEGHRVAEQYSRDFEMSGECKCGHAAKAVACHDDAAIVGLVLGLCVIADRANHGRETLQRSRAGAAAVAYRVNGPRHCIVSPALGRMHGCSLGPTTCSWEFDQ